MENNKYKKMSFPKFWRPAGWEVKKLGFTLIELLVVVLIIGILAAVALPQYQKAVWKSRYTQAKTIAKSVADAEEVYYLANGNYTRNYDELDVEIPTQTSPIRCYSEGCYTYYTWGTCTLNEGGTRCTLFNNGAQYLTYIISFNNNPSRQGTYCLAHGGDRVTDANDINYQICVADTGNPNSRGSWSDNGKTWGWKYLQ